MASNNGGATVQAVGKYVRLTGINNFSALDWFPTDVQVLEPSGTISGTSGNTITLSESRGTWDDSGTHYVIGPATTPATGTVASTDPVANTITLSQSDETSPKRWIVNQGKFVKGPLSPSKDAAPEVEGLTLFSSAFTSTPAGSLGQTGASWQVAAYDDINFASPVAQELDSTTDLTQWPVVPELAEETQYRCRVRHISADQESEWSDPSTFKTDKDQTLIDKTKPGIVLRFDDRNPADPCREIPGPVEFQNLAVDDANRGGALAVGIDGNLYHTSNYSSFTKVSGVPEEGNIPRVVAENNYYWSYVTTTGNVYSSRDWVVDDWINGIVTGEIAKLSTFGKDSLSMYAVSKDGKKLWFYGEINGQKYNSWTEQNVVFPADTTLTSVASLKRGDGFILCFSDGTIHCFGTPQGDKPQYSGGVFPNSPKVFTVPGLNSDEQVTKIANIRITYSSDTNIQFLTNQNRLYVSSTNGSAGAFNQPMEQFYGTADDRFTSFILMRFRNLPDGLIIKDDGKIYIVPYDASKSPNVECNVSPYPDDKNKTWGTLPYAYSANQTGETLFLLVD